MNKKLNTTQLDAVKHKTGPLLIVAGAGTGKTTVITERIKYLIEKKIAKPSEILGLTFTEKAAFEMESRVDETMPLSYSPVWMMTFHSFCDRVLRESAIHIGLSPDYKLLTEAESLHLIKKNLFEFELNYFRPLGNPHKYLQAMVQHFSKLKDENVSPEEYLKSAKNENIELAKAYLKYQELKIKENVMDFGDLIYYALKLFKTRPNILEKYQERFKYILVDEFQDTNYSQNELIKLLSQKSKNVTVVCDDNQSIYKFRGASISNILDFRKTFPETKLVVLNQNYRSTQVILDSAYKLIKHNDPDTLEYQEKINKKLIALKKGKLNDIETKEFENGQKEAEFIAGEIINQKYNFKDVAVLVRANSHADIIQKVFEREGLPYQFLGPSKLFQKKFISQIISFLRCLVDPFDNANFYEVLNIPYFGFTPLVIARLVSRSRHENVDLFEISPEKIKTFILRYMEKAKAMDVGNLVYEFLDETGAMDKITKEESEADQKNAIYLSKFFGKIKDFENQSSKDSVRSFVDWVDLLIELKDTPSINEDDWQDNEAVNIITVHSSKGLEFPVVFMPSLVMGRFPSYGRSETLSIPAELIKEKLPEGDFQMQEERRLFYVGMTRAKEKLYLTWAKKYTDKQEKKVSPFVIEATNGIFNFQFPISNEFLIPKISKPQNLQASKLTVSYLSYSQIETFKSCELHYKLKYILNVPSKPSAVLSFGNTIHTTLNKFYTSKCQENLLKLYEDAWINEGYQNKKHEELQKKRGEKYLKDYLKFGLNKTSVTKLLEYEIRNVILPKKEGEVVLKIGGRIDRVDILPDGTLEVVDYKTGENVPTQKETDKNLQMSFYALLISLSDNPLFKIDIEKVKFSFYYFEENKWISTTRTKDDLVNTIDLIYETRKKIETSHFLCTGYFCTDCEYKSLCSRD